MSDNVLKAVGDRSALVGVLQGLLFEIEEKGAFTCLADFVQDADEREKTMQALTPAPCFHSWTVERHHECGSQPSRPCRKQLSASGLLPRACGQ